MNIFNLTKTKGTHFLHNTKVPVNISLTKIPAFLRSPEEIFYRNDPLGANDLSGVQWEFKNYYCKDAGPATLFFS